MDPSFQDLLKRLDHLSDQFSELRDGVQKAVRIADLDPEMALTRARKVLELVVRDVYERRCNEPPGTRPLENLLHGLSRTAISPTVSTPTPTPSACSATSARTPSARRSRPLDVYQSLTQLMPILEWYFEVERPEALGRTTRTRGSRPTPLPVRSVAPSAASTAIAVVPKGLRSFDARRRLLPRSAARPARQGRPARKHPLLEAPDRGRRRTDLHRGRDLRAQRAAANRRW